MTKAQTIASRKYNAKVGIIAKSFRLKKDLCESFKEACEQNGESQAGVITALMKGYIEKTKKENAGVEETNKDE